MNARLLSKAGRAFRAHWNGLLYAVESYAAQPDLQLNRMIARPGRWMRGTSTPLPPAAWDLVTRNLSREHVKHKYKRPGCRF